MRTAFLCILALMLALSACGKRASVMEAPEGDNPHAFPHHYPDSINDPPGVYVPPGSSPNSVPAALQQNAYPQSPTTQANSPVLPSKPSAP